MDLLTSTRQKTARLCLRLHKIRYELGYAPAREDDALRFGDLVHKGLEGWFLAPAERMGAALEAMAGEADLFERAKAEAMLIGYDARWGGEELEVVAVESVWGAPLRNPETGRASRTWKLGGKFDGIVRRDGRLLVMEHKTTSEDMTPGSGYWLRLQMDGQVSTYLAGAKAIGHAVEGVLYDVIGKPTLRPLKATPMEARKYTKPTKADPEPRLYANQREADETPEQYRARMLEDIAANPNAYFARGEVVRLESEVAEAAHDTWQTAALISNARRAGHWPRNPDACVRYGRPCSFFEVCTGQASLDDATRYRRLEDVHPELVAVAAQ